MTDFMDVEPGENLAVWRGSELNRVTVHRLTKTMIITTTGARFNRLRGDSVGSDNRSFREQLVRLDDPEVVAQFKKQDIKAVTRRVQMTTQKLVETPNLEQVTHVEKALEVLRRVLTDG